MTQPKNVGELKKSGWVSRPVKEEMRQNAVALISAGKPLRWCRRIRKHGPPTTRERRAAGHDVIFLENAPSKNQND